MNFSEIILIVGLDRKDYAMKTAEEFYKEISESKELQSELKTASDEMLRAFLKKHGCDADVKEFTDYIRSQNEGELDDDEAEAAAGGIFYPYEGVPVAEPPQVII